MWDIFNHANFSIGLNIVIEHHNGLRELLNREDAGKLILDFYNNIDLNRIKELREPVDKGNFVVKSFYLELFMSYPTILRQFQGKEKKVLKALLSSYNKCIKINKETKSDTYDGYAIGTKVLALGRTLNKLKNKKSDNLAIELMDLGKLSKESYQNIIEEASKE